jgi:23S rRNA pseudouridine955/2504/2580 synthase
MSAVVSIKVEPAEGDIRLDRWFKRRFPALAHGRLEKLLRTGQVRVDGKRARANLRLEPGQVVRVPPLDGLLTPAPANGKTPARPRPAEDRMAAELRQRVLYRDAEALVIDKPAGLAVQGGTSTDLHLDGLLDALRFDASERPRLVHRLDKDTSGVLVLARNAAAAARLAEAFRRKETRKIYWAAVVGQPRLRHGRIDLALSKQGSGHGEKVLPDEEGQRAVTYYSLVEHAGKRASWLALMPITGRTHQLRAHCVALGTPILGDGKYGGQGAFIAGTSLPRQLHLHARSIRLPKPGGGPIAASAPLPEHMRKTWQFFGFDPDPQPEPLADIEL